MITFVIFTYNEERRIENVIRNYQQYGKVLLADGGSTDKTHEIARNNDCEVFIRPETSHAFVENGTVMDALYKILTTEWVFLGYADEHMNKVTLEKLIDVVINNKFDAIKIYRKNYFYGDFCNDSYKSSNNRLFKTWAYDFTDNYIHGMGKQTVSDDRIYNLPPQYFIHHFIDCTLDSHLSKINRYTDSEQLVHSNLKSKTSIFYFFYLIIKNLVKNYFFEKGYKTGFAALSLAELTIFYDIVKNIKIYESQHQITDETIDKKNNLHRIEILKDFINTSPVDDKVQKGNLKNGKY
ncbi:glycosyltransferase [Pedobacter mendelii]|uniref:Beta 1,4 glucosyltransferase n=1 Tax=Pedobacter mendelii TaxID=1908240 RepID=A0ABQ2BML9_9SPHI|nr:glycosyltransferase [Pedobacter mendelii]GGI28257.1 beta 1,4 glucosyltransferase [Pedobacter mendelii]